MYVMGLNETMIQPRVLAGAQCITVHDGKWHRCIKPCQRKPESDSSTHLSYELRAADTLITFGKPLRNNLGPKRGRAPSGKHAEKRGGEGSEVIRAFGMCSGVKEG